jgi:hypothetical protein
MLNRDDVAAAIGLAQAKNAGIAKDVREFFRSLIDAHNLFLEIQQTREKMGTLERNIGGFDFLAKKLYGVNRPKMIGEMEEQMAHNHGSADYERISIVDKLEENTRELARVQDELEVNSAEWNALYAALSEYVRFTWAFKDLRSDVRDIFIVPNVQDIFWRKLAEMEMEAGEA